MNLLNEREKTHGSFEDVSRVAQEFKTTIWAMQDTHGLPWLHKEALEMICTKIARIVCGDHNEPDHWTDIMGYAKLVLKTLEVPPGSSPIQEPSDEPDYTDSDYYIPRSGLPR
jgi:hypothetical protein